MPKFAGGLPFLLACWISSLVAIPVAVAAGTTSADDDVVPGDVVRRSEDLGRDRLDFHETLLRLKSKNQEQADFRFTAELALARRARENIRVQWNGMGLGMVVSRDQAVALSRCRAGSLIEFSGHVGGAGPSHRLAKLEHFEMIDPDHRADVSPARVAGGQFGTPLTRLGYAEGIVEEVWLRSNQLHLIVGANNTVFETVIAGSFDQSQFVHLLGKRVGVTGCVFFNRIQHAKPPLCKICAMAMDQIQVLGPELGSRKPSRTEAGIREKPLASLEIDGVVAYSNRFDGLAVFRNGKRFWLDTRLAHRFAAGDRVRSICEESRNQTSDITVGRNRMISQAYSNAIQLPVIDPECAPLESLQASAALPPQVRTCGTVKFCEFLENTLLIHLYQGGEDFLVVISMGASDYDELPFDLLVNGTDVIVTGFPRRVLSSDDSKPSSSRPSSEDSVLEIYVSSVDNVQIVDYPVTVNSTFLYSSLFAGLFLTCVFIYWIYRLRTKVKVGSVQLTEIDSHLRGAFEAVQGALMIVDSNDRIVRVNGHFTDLFGFHLAQNSLLLQHVERLDEKFDVRRNFSTLYKTTQHASSGVFSDELTSPSGDRTIQVFSSPVGADGGKYCDRLWMFEDVTERRQLEANLLHSQKMEAVGRLSGGIAHDFNNFLSVIRSSVNTIDTRGIDNGECVRVANTAVSQASELTQQLLGFARRSRLQCDHVDANALIREIASMMRGLIEPSRSLFLHQSEFDDLILVDKGRMQQALINLCLNARDAVAPEVGEIILSVQRIEHERLGDAVQIRITDNGIGMSKESSQRIFEPFFTTKDVGEGTGLGLSVAQGIVEQHGGRLDCMSELGVGTSFDITLPLVQSESASSITVTEPRHAAPAESLRVLLVDDDDLVRTSTASLLRSLTHEVVEASNGMRALRELALSKKFDLVILDVVMPEMSGVETFKEIYSAWPHLPVVFYSGFDAPEQDLGQVVASRRPPLMMKPFTVEQVNAVIGKAILDSTTAADLVLASADVDIGANVPST